MKRVHIITRACPFVSVLSVVIFLAACIPAAMSLRALRMGRG